MRRREMKRRELEHELEQGFCSQSGPFAIDNRFRINLILLHNKMSNMNLESPNYMRCDKLYRRFDIGL